MNSSPIFEFINELSECNYNTLAEPYTLESFKYNGITYAESSDTYSKVLQSHFLGFKASTLELSANKSERELRTVLDELERVSGQYYDVPDDLCVESMENDYASSHNQSLLKSIREAKFLKEMVAVQKFFTAEAIRFVSSLLPEQSVSKEAKQTEVPQKQESDWLTLDEVCAKYRLPKNNIKDRKWRLKNNFPTGNKGAYEKLTFHSKEVEEWLNSGTKC